MRIVYTTGQTCNQFWIQTNSIAESIEYGKKVYFWTPDVSIKDFGNLESSNYIGYIFYPKRLISWIGYKRYFRLQEKILKNRAVIKAAKLFFNSLPGTSFEIAKTSYAHNPCRSKHIEKLKEIFQPNRELKEAVANLFTSYRTPDSIVIGIHIRYGDYRTYLNGKYYYELSDYAQFMAKLSEAFTGKTVYFFIASNERIDMTLFSGLNHFVIPNGSATADLIGLSLCDYICGPPSTFSAWASLYNEKPLYFIEDINIIPKENDFFNIRDKFNV